MNTQVPACDKIYAISRWGDGYFHINPAGHLCARPDPDDGAEIDLVELAQRARAEGLALPVLVRFNDILRHRVRTLHQAFAKARQALGYGGDYLPAYPIKVNQQRSVVEQILNTELTGLEAGSKPELMAVLALSRPGGLVICNGYKDRGYVRLALIGLQLGLRVHIVIEKPSELSLVLEEAQRLDAQPLLGVRVRLAASAAGNWQSSGGEKAKFGLTPTQILAFVQRLADAGKLGWLRMLHAHLGSQIPNLQDIRRGLRELVRYYAELRRTGAPIDTVDVGGGLGVDYEGTRTRDFCSINYRLDDYAEAVVGALKGICDAERLPEPAIVSESGRALTAHHAVLITNVTDQETVVTEPPAYSPGKVREPLLQALEANLAARANHPPLATFETARALLQEVRDGFEAGQVALATRSRAEDLFVTTCASLARHLSGRSRRQREVLDRINELLASKLYCNFSLFQSVPDIWGIDQIFPIAPLQRLDEPPRKRGVLNDLTCDSDGCITRYVDQNGVEASLPVHELRPGEDYLLGVFLVGAYQEILGDMHNLFGDTDAVNVELDGHGGYRLLEPERGDSVDELLSYVHFDPRAMMASYRRKLNASGLDRTTREGYFVELKAGLYGYTYLDSN
jgi:arginine decarboxylase